MNALCRPLGIVFALGVALSAIAQVEDAHSREIGLYNGPDLNQLTDVASREVTLYNGPSLNTIENAASREITLLNGPSVPAIVDAASREINLYNGPSQEVITDAVSRESSVHNRVVWGYLTLRDLSDYGAAEGDPVEVRVYPAGSQTLAYSNVTTLGRNGYYSFVPQAEGPFDIEVRTTNWMTRRKGPLNIGAEAVYASFDGSYSLPNGDATGDDTVDDADLTVVIIDFGRTDLMPTENGYTDLNRDGVVDDADITLVILSYGLSGD